MPDLTFAKNFNDLDQAWIKAKELLLAFPKESSFREIGYDLIIEFMNPNLVYDKNYRKKQNSEINKIPLESRCCIKK